MLEQPSAYACARFDDGKGREGSATRHAVDKVGVLKAFYVHRKHLTEGRGGGGGRRRM